MREEPNHGLRPALCRHCHAEIVWGTLQNGQHRPFNRQPERRERVAPSSRYAYSRRVGAVVCLDGEPHPPELVLTAHHCPEYAEWRDRAMQAFSAPSILEDRHG